MNSQDATTCFDPIKDDQSKLSANSSEEEKIYISSFCPGEKIVENPLKDLDSLTLYHTFKKSCEMHGEKDCLGTLANGISYSWVSYNDVYRSAQNIGSGLLKLLSEPVSNRKVGIYSKNRMEWDVVNIACCLYGMTLVPFYDTLGAEALSYILNQTEIDCLIVDHETKLNKIIQSLRDNSKLKSIVVLESKGEVTKKLEESGLQVLSFQNVFDNGANDRHPEVAPDPDLPFVIIYTSGTTGTPKGVVLTHRNIIVEIGSAITTLELNNHFSFTSNDTMMSYLPSAHTFNIVMTHVMFYSGGRIGYFRGNILKLMDDAKILKPTIFPIVPRLLNKIYDKVWASANENPVKSYLMTKAYESKKEQLMTTGDHTHFLWDKVVFRGVRDLLGGEVRFMITGAAPISAEVLTFMRCSFSCIIVEAYGQTECSGAATMTWPGDPKSGHVGGPITCTEIKLVPVPEMNYLQQERKGEICFRGPNCFKEYYKDPKNTAETIDSQGWVHSGDIGEWLPNGTLKIIDRKKHIFKLSQGEYIAPEKIENIYTQDPLVMQAFVHGESLENCTVAIIVPELEQVEAFIKNNNSINQVEEITLKSICKNDKIKREIHQRLLEMGKKYQLNALEQVKAIHLSSTPFTVENDLLTPTFKAKRSQIRNIYQNEITALYDSLR